MLGPHHTFLELAKKTNHTFRPCLWLGQADILHEFKGKGHIVHFLVEVLWREMEAVQRDKEAFQQSHEKCQVDSIVELGVQVIHLQVHFVQMLVDKCHQ